jgi:hypothetical protein
VLLTSAPITINDTSQGPPTLISITSTSTVGTNINQTLYSRAVAINPIDNSYVHIAQAFSNQISPAYRSWVIKYKKFGIIEWAYQYGTPTANYVTPGYVTFDDTGNIYFAVEVSTGTTTPDSAYIVKLNSAGGIVWQRKLSTSYAVQPRSIIYSTVTNSVYIGAKIIKSLSAPYNYGIGVFKYNSSGTIQWQKSLSRADTNGTSIILETSMTVDQFGDVYMTSNSSISYRDPESTVIKLSGGTGALLWQRMFVYVGANSGPQFYGIGASNNLYVTGSYNNNNLIFSMTTSTGAVRWVRSTVPPNSNSQPFYNPTPLIENGVEYVYANVYYNNQYRIIKLDINGNLTTDRTVGLLGVNKLSIDSTSTLLYASLGTTQNSAFSNVILPLDGSKTGTYTLRINPDLPNTMNFVYSVGTLTNTNIQSIAIPTAQAGTFALATAGLTESAGDLVATNMLTYLKTNVLSIS